jgi:hypothetical protein
VLTITTDGECLTCSGFSLDETICLGRFESINDYFIGLSLPPRRSNSDTAFMGSTRSGSPYPWRTIIEDSIDEFYTASIQSMNTTGQSIEKMLSVGMDRRFQFYHRFNR